LLGCDELVVGVSTHIVDVLNNERVTEGMLREQYDLCASRCEFSDNSFTNSAGATLQRISVP
jgi:hypothetical protein